MRKAEMIIKVTNQLTGEVVTDVHHYDFPYEYALEFARANKANHEAFREINPDCCVNMQWKCEGSEWCFIYGMPLNQQKDEQLIEAGEMSWDEYMEKWYPKNPQWDEYINEEYPEEI